MDRSKKKHLKALRRQKKLEKRGQHGLPCRVIIKELDIDRTRLKNFEEVALGNIDIKGSVRHLYETRQDFRRAFPPKRTDQVSEFTRILLGELITRQAFIPPYFIPFTSAAYSNSCNAVLVACSVFRPQRKTIGVHGTVYNFGKEINLPTGETLNVWYCSHAIDRIQERFNLEKTEADIYCWQNILCGTKLNYWDWNPETKLLTYFIHTVLQQEVIKFPIYFPCEGSELNLVAKTMLLPGMTGVPKFQDMEMSQVYNIIKGVRHQWHMVWDLIARGEQGIALMESALGLPIQPGEYHLDSIERWAKEPRTKPVAPIIKKPEPESNCTQVQQAIQQINVVGAPVLRGHHSHLVTIDDAALFDETNSSALIDHVKTR